jgi:hypothetical protein
VYALTNSLAAPGLAVGMSAQVLFCDIMFLSFPSVFLSSTFLFFEVSVLSFEFAQYSTCSQLPLSLSEERLCTSLFPFSQRLDGQSE